MGSSAPKLFGSMFGYQEIRVLMIGLDSAGKTTILYKLKLDEIVTTIPTVGFNVETISHKNISFTLWDVGGGRFKIALRRHYYQNTQGVIFVIDSSDVGRIDETAETLHLELSHDGFRDTPVLIFANKQDLPNALSESQLVNRIRLHQVRQQWHIQACCAATGDGLYEGLDWLAMACSNTPQPEPAAQDGT